MDKGRKGRRHSVPHVQMHEESGVSSSSSSSSRSRLAIIAPRNEKDKGLAVLRSPKDGVFKERLPPRSRTGCWTCRTRKVKCSEEHPICSQCARLQHQCDYHPRLSFRDDTRRIVDRMPEVSTVDSSIWDPKARSRRASIVAIENSELKAIPEALSLPLFSQLTTDEDRELKASTRIPATYILGLTPQSFVSDENDQNLDKTGDISPSSEKIKIEDEDTSPISDRSPIFGKKPLVNLVISSSPATTSDPDIVMLARFEEPTMKFPSLSASATSSTGRRHSLASIRSNEAVSTATSKSSPRFDATRAPVAITFKEEEEEEPIQFSEQLTLPFATPTFSQSISSTDLLYLHYYRTVVSPHIFHVRGVGSIWNPAIDGEDFFDVEASKFPPLFHAMMAISAFSCEHKNPNGENFVQPLQHYQAVLPALQSSLSSPIDLTSDGILYTHFFLLLYEIAAAEPGRPNLWQQHLSQLRGFIFERALLSASGSTPFIIWYLVSIDVVASLAGVGDGDLTESFLRNNLITNLKNTLAPSASTDGLSMFSSPVHQALESKAFLQTLSLNQELVLLGSTIAKTRAALKAVSPLTAELVTEESVLNTDVQASVRENQVQQILEELQRVWIFRRTGMQTVTGEPEIAMSTRLSVLQSQATLFYHALNLYTRTSMWPQQVQEMADVESNSTEILLSIQSIVTECTQILNHPEIFFSTGFLVFPLFMAGVSSTDVSVRTWVLDTLLRAGVNTIGRNCTVVKAALQNIYQRQNAVLLGPAGLQNMEWQDLLCGFGVPVALFGF